MTNAYLNNHFFARLHKYSGAPELFVTDQYENLIGGDDIDEITISTIEDAKGLMAVLELFIKAKEAESGENSKSDN